MQNIKSNVNIFILGFLLFFSEGAIYAQVEENKIDLSKLSQNDSCIDCHLEDESMPEDFSDDDIHMQAGLSCSGCHGGVG